jgi:hypothetical protein
MRYNGAGKWLKFIEALQDKALIVSIFVPSELVTCSIITMFQTFEGNIGDASCRVLVMHRGSSEW